ncbi:hypothetical protein H4R19_004923 [Coemansia spiralis]|nr:hypothetical protein H4R19_004923 [Coemansia spiralis]
MLSSGITSRVERLQHHGTGAAEMTACADYASLSRGAPAVSRAKTGLAADLIHKFNQLSAASRAATQGRAAAARDASRQREPLLSSAGTVWSAVTHKEAGDNGCWSGAQQQGQWAGSAAGRTSPFLSDIELDRALFEIREFGRAVGIKL